MENFEKKPRYKSSLERAIPVRPQKILVACHNVVLSGGLLRFDRLGEVLRQWGHDVAFVAFSDDVIIERPTILPILSLEQAKSRQWDAVMIPGAGFPDDTIKAFSVFQNPSFGIRVQHFLNDQTIRDRFKKVNESFSPHIVIFNSQSWPVGSYTDFKADRFHVLLGAVDTSIFRPKTYRQHTLMPDKWVVGGSSNKNPIPLIKAIYQMPENITLRLYGKVNSSVAKKFSDSKKIEFLGPLHGKELSQFYHNVDCVVMTEMFAGWANMVAEAMSSGVPVVCTKHGTSAFAFHEESALVVEDVSSSALSDALYKLYSDAKLCERLTERACSLIQDFSWENYACDLLKLITSTR